VSCVSRCVTVNLWWECLSVSDSDVRCHVTLQIREERKYNIRSTVYRNELSSKYVSYEPLVSVGIFWDLLVT